MKIAGYLLLFLGLASASFGANADPFSIGATLASAASSIPTILSVASGVIGVVSAISQGNAAEKNAQWQAKQLEARAGQERASAQRMALEERRQARLAMSRAQAVAGGGAGDESVLELTGDIAGEGEYNALTSIYEGEESARGRETQAMGLRAEGKAARRASLWKAAGSALGTASTMYDRYGNGGFSNQPKVDYRERY